MEVETVTCVYELDEIAQTGGLTKCWAAQIDQTAMTFVVFRLSFQSYL